MKAKDIRELSTEEIQIRIAEKKEELFKLRFQNALGQLENTTNLSTVRRDIARLNTILTEKGRQADAQS